MFGLAGSWAAAATPFPAPTHVPSVQFPFPNWVVNLAKPSLIPQGRIEIIKRWHGRMYVGGDIVQAQGPDGKIITRHGAAAIDPATGRILPFAPECNGRVLDFLFDDARGVVYLAGQFTEVAGKPQTFLAAVDPETGARRETIPDLHFAGGIPSVLPWHVPSPEVRRLAFFHDRIYFGGNFALAAGQPRSELGDLEFDAASGRWHLGSWAPRATPGKPPFKVAVVLAESDYLIVGGSFDALNGDPRGAKLAMLDPTTGQIVRTFDHLPPQSDGQPFPFSEVIQAVSDHHNLYVAMGGPGGMSLAYTLPDGKRKWHYSTDGNVQAAALYHGYVVFGFHGDYVANQPNRYIHEYRPKRLTADRVERRKLFVCDPDTGALQPWAPRFLHREKKFSVMGVWALDTTADELAAAGDFTELDGQPIDRFALFRAAP